MLLFQLAFAAALSLSVCILTQPLTGNSATQSCAVAAGRLMAVALSTSVSFVLTPWLADTSLLAIMLVQLSLACYLAYIAVSTGINNAALSLPTQVPASAVYTLFFHTSVSILCRPVSLFSLGIFSLFISSQHSEWKQMIGIGSVHLAVVIGNLFIFPAVCRGTVFNYQYASSARIRIFLLAASVVIAWRAVAHLVLSSYEKIVSTGIT